MPLAIFTTDGKRYEPTGENMTATEGSKFQERTEGAALQGLISDSAKQQTKARTPADVATELAHAIDVKADGDAAAAIIPALRAELDALIGKAPRKARAKKVVTP